MGVFVGNYESLDALIERAQAHELDDSPAMGEIIKRFEPLVARAAWRGGSPSINDDVANFCRLALVRAVRRHSGQPGFASYAKRYVVGAAHRARQRTSTPVEIVPLADEHDAAVPGEDRSGHWGSGDVRDAIEQLPVEQRRLLELRYVEDLTLSQIAAAFGGVSESAVSQRLNTAHRRIRSLLEAA